MPIRSTSRAAWVTGNSSRLVRYGAAPDIPGCAHEQLVMAERGELPEAYCAQSDHIKVLPIGSLKPYIHTESVKMQYQMPAPSNYNKSGSVPPAMITPPAHDEPIFWSHGRLWTSIGQSYVQQQPYQSIDVMPSWPTSPPPSATTHLPSPTVSTYIPSPTVPTFLPSPTASAYPRSRSPPPPTPSRRQRNHLACPFYINAPSCHPKCAQKRFPYMCRVR